MKKIILALLSIFMLTGCGVANGAYAAQEPASSAEVIPVSNIITTDPVITLEVGEEYILQYQVLPYNATDKSVRADVTYLKDIARVTVEDEETVSVFGLGVGEGVLSLLTHNDKYVSYSVNVLPKEPEPQLEPLVYDVEDLVQYYNSAVPEEFMKVQYQPEYSWWFMEYVYSDSDDTSADNLKRPVEYLRQFLPMKGEVEGGFLMEDVRGTKEATAAVPFKRYLLIAVSSNFFAAVTLRGFIYDEKLYAQVFIYDGRNGTFA